MRRKTKPSPITTVSASSTLTAYPIDPEVKPEPGAAELVPAESESTENTENTESAESTALAARRPRKKLRRPTLSDTVPAIPVAAFQRMVRHMAEEFRPDLRWEDEALRALQADAEAFLIEKFQKAKETSDLFGRSTTSQQFSCLMRA
jgi:histone H3/H4